MAKRSDSERFAEILRILAGEVDRKLGRRAAMLVYLIEMARLEAEDLARTE